jgi:catechol 2,3-dioxygenase-like lactoylglutathione lyase family enzyme
VALSYSGPAVAVDLAAAYYGRMEAHIRYIAIVSEQPDELARFYGHYLGLRELGRGTAGDVSLTDGFYNLTILKQRAGLGEPDERLGLNHFGVEIDDIHEVEARLEDFAPNADIRQEPGDVHHGEYRVFDPNGLAVSLSTKRFHVDGEKLGWPRIRHVAMQVPKNDEVLDFFRNVFGFRETETSRQARKIENPARFAGDGHTSLAILRDPDRIRLDHRETDERNIRFGVNHFGFLVPDLAGMLALLPDAAARPSIRPMAEYRAYDPDLNGFDLSQEKGFEVDDGTWERVPASAVSGS